MSFEISQDTYKNAKWVRQPHGHIIVDGQEVASTLRCCHCQRIFIPVRGSGQERGFCLKCMQVTCGRPECNVCIPCEKKLTLAEKGVLLKDL